MSGAGRAARAGGRRRLAAGPGTPPFRRILCAIDFSPASLRALRYAVKLQQAGVELTVLHVVEWQFEDEPGARLAGFDVPEFRATWTRTRASGWIEPCATSWASAGGARAGRGGALLARGPEGGTGGPGRTSW